MPETMNSLFRSAVLLPAALALVACAAEEDGVADGPADVAASSEGADEAKNLEEFVGTAWRVSAEDGARYVTYLDAEGRYRDLRNGDPWQEGGWALEAAPGDEEGQVLLCFQPEGDNVRERCWETGKLDDGKLIVTSGGGRRVQLEKAAYEAPQDAETAEAAR